MTHFRKARFFWAVPLAVWLFLSANTSERSLRLGTLFVLCGEAIRLWANGYVGHVKVNWTQKWRNDPKIGQLITAGPYALVRHPLYVGTFLIGLGLCVAVRNAWLAAGALMFFVLAYTKKAKREEALIHDEVGPAYQAYLRAVPRWIPNFRRYPQAQGQWSWRGIRASRELKTVAWVLVCLLALYFREELWQKHEPFMGSHWVKHSLLTLLGLGLIVSDGIVELLRRTARTSFKQGTTV